MTKLGTSPGKPRNSRGRIPTGTGLIFTLVGIALVVVAGIQEPPAAFGDGDDIVACQTGLKVDNVADAQTVVTYNSDTHTGTGGNVVGTDPNGAAIVGLCVKSANTHFIYPTPGSSCYTVTGLGTTSVTITETGGAGCQDISHVDLIVGSVPTSTPTATATSTNTPTATATSTNTPQAPTNTPTATATSTNTPQVPTSTPTATATATNTPQDPTSTPTATATSTNTPQDPTSTPTATATATNTPQDPTSTPTPEEEDPTATPTVGLTAEVAGVQATPEPSPTAPATAATFTSEVLGVQSLPSTGTGGSGGSSTSTWLFGVGLIVLGTLLFFAGRAMREERE